MGFIDTINNFKEPVLPLLTLLYHKIGFLNIMRGVHRAPPKSRIRNEPNPGQSLDLEETKDVIWSAPPPTAGGKGVSCIISLDVPGPV